MIDTSIILGVTLLPDSDYNIHRSPVLFLGTRKDRAFFMELIIINENKLKIMLSGEEMIKYALDRFDSESPAAEIRLAFRNMMDDIKFLTGFDADGEQLYIQLYPCRSGGGEMYITKLCCSPCIGASNGEPLSELATTGSDRLRGEVYFFSEISDLLSACRALEARCPELDTAAYLSDNNEYMLVLDGAANDCAQRLLDEFGRRERSETINVYIHEHWKKICEGNAVKILSHC